MLDGDTLRDCGLCGLDPDTELRNFQNYMFIAVFSDVRDIYMINSILRKTNAIRFYKIVLFRLRKRYVEYDL